MIKGILLLLSVASTVFNNSVDMVADNKEQQRIEAEKSQHRANADVAKEELLASIEAERQAAVQTYYASNTTYNDYSNYEYSTNDVLTKSGGVNYYNGYQRETYYNLDMSRVVANAQNAGIEGEYWVREDGVKMYGEYVIAAANQDTHPYGTTVDTSLGEAVVLDTGDFAYSNPEAVDIAVEW